MLGKTWHELQAVAAKASFPAYAVGQMAGWLYRKRITTIDAMTDLAAVKRLELAKYYEIGSQPPVKTTTSADGAIKYLFATGNGAHCVESVYIPSNDRATLCVSSQSGCKMNCLFCQTGKQGFTAQLTANEIMNQIQSVPENLSLTNLVFMGMGEPFDNIDALFKTLDILTSPYGYGWSPKRITVSTIGLLPELKRFLDESRCHLAISLHSPYHEERLALMPVEKVYPARQLLDVLRGYDFTHQRRVSFEYILFDRLNDTPRHAKALAQLLKGLECRVNLIRYHAIPGVDLRACDEQKMEQFRDFLQASGVVCTVRTSRGEDVFAACGMLSTAKKIEK